MTFLVCTRKVVRLSRVSCDYGEVIDFRNFIGHFVWSLGAFAGYRRWEAR